MNFFNSHLNKYLVPRNLNFVWNLGFILGALFLCQLISGVLLVLFYVNFKEGTFESIRRVSLESNFGWYLRSYHSMGVSGYFCAMFCHIMKGIWFSSRFLPWSWFTGMLIYILSIAISFMGYALPNGQMSYWGAIVIKNLLEWSGRGNTIIFGNHGVGPETLQRFFLLHFTLPFVVLIIVVLHIYVLHRNSSSNPMIPSDSYLTERFFPTAFLGDVKLFVTVLVVIGFQVGYGQISLFQADPDNSIESNGMVTPIHIIPEWYLLIFYATLKLFPTKITGLVAMACLLEALVVLVESRTVSPILSGAHYHRSWTSSYVLVVPTFFMLGLIGKMVANFSLVMIGMNVLILSLSSIGRSLDSVRIRC